MLTDVVAAAATAGACACAGAAAARRHAQAKPEAAGHRRRDPSPRCRGVQASHSTAARWCATAADSSSLEEAAPSSSDMARASASSSWLAPPSAEWMASLSRPRPAAPGASVFIAYVVTHAEPPSRDARPAAAGCRTGSGGGHSRSRGQGESRGRPDWPEQREVLRRPDT